MICDNVERFIGYALKNGLIENTDIYVIRNQLMEALGLTDWQHTDAEYSDETIDDILAPLVDHACENGIIADTANSRDLYDTKLMGIITPMPREVNARFMQLCKKSSSAATDWYYDLGKKLNYIRAERMKKDLRWKFNSEYGELDITINRSKPEKDPRDIALAKTAQSTDYPKCMLCPENAGFAGNVSRPARQNLRPVSVEIGGEPWQLQYSPYGYYNEHCILFNTRHTPMKIDRSVFEKLFDAVDRFPDYFFGSNADLPIVGGSILSHEHFQGGRYTFAMEKAPIEYRFALERYSNVSGGILRWPMSVIRLYSENRTELTEACTMILNMWKEYDNKQLDIISHTGNIPHNTITPIARKNQNTYTCDLVLRNNRTLPERPLGIFHPNPSLHHIKKENIGLIEVMGLAVLPARLAKETELLKQCMCNGTSISEKPEIMSHAEWASDILNRYHDFSEKTADDILKREIGAVFEQVLFDSGVFKRDNKGKAAFENFVQDIQKCHI